MPCRYDINFFVDMNKAVVSDDIQMSFIDFPCVGDYNGICLSVYVRGCVHGCLGCHNSESLGSFSESDGYSLASSYDVYSNIMKRLVGKPVRSVSILGGDPCHPKNVCFTRSLVRMLHDSGIRVMVYTGYGIEYFKSLSIIGFDFVKTGRFDIDNMNEVKHDRDMNKFILSSKNQELYDGNYNLLTINGIYEF